MSIAHNAKSCDKGRWASDGQTLPPADRRTSQWLRTIKRVVLRAAPIVVLVGLTSWFGYATGVLRDELAALDSTASEILAALRLYPRSDASSPAYDPNGAFAARPVVPTEIDQKTERSDQVAQKIREIEEKVDTILETMRSVNSQFEGIIAQSKMDPRQAFDTLQESKLPVLPSVLSQMGTNLPETIPGVASETRTDINNILRHHAHDARAALQLASDGDALDRAEVQLIKQETRARAASELRTLLPEDVYDQMFPTDSIRDSR